MIPGAWCASLAAFRSFVNRSSKVLVVNIWVPEGWRILLVGSCGVNSFADALLASRETFAAELTKVVSLRFWRFSQPG